MGLFRTATALALAAALVAAASPALAQTTAQECLAAQQRYSGGACKGIAHCYAKAMSSGTALSQDCIAKQKQKLVTAAAAVEAVANCLVKGIMPSVGDQLTMGDDDVASSLTLAGGHCAAVKMGSLGKACASFFRCNATADANSTTLDPLCIQPPAQRLRNAFTKIEATGRCVTKGDESTLEGKIANLVDSVHTELRGTGTTTTTATATTL
ncbi:MAG TPA: hypothetical protein VGK20_19120 [Candidatus Binatia bacterium]|jgi:hypothetical protein